MPPVRPPKEGPTRGHRRPLIQGHRIGNIVGTSIIRLIGAVLLEQNDEWQLQHRYMQVEAMAELTAPVSEAETRQIAA